MVGPNGGHRTIALPFKYATDHVFIFSYLCVIHCVTVTIFVDSAYVYCFFVAMLFVCFPLCFPTDSIPRLMIVWRIRGKIITTYICALIIYSPYNFRFGSFFVCFVFHIRFLKKSFVPLLCVCVLHCLKKSSPK